jgi:hypothetical protein
MFVSVCPTSYVGPTLSACHDLDLNAIRSCIPLPLYVCPLMYCTPLSYLTHVLHTSVLSRVLYTSVPYLMYCTPLSYLMYCTPLSYLTHVLYTSVLSHVLYTSVLCHPCLRS